MRVRLVLTAVIVFVLAGSASFADLEAYVNKPDDSFAFELTAVEQVGAAKAHVIKLTSQTWQGHVWTHWLSVYVPAEIKRPGHAMLLVNGGDNGNGARYNQGEGPVLAQAAAMTGTITANLEQVPNQPLFGGMKEDAIISYTFEQYLNGEGSDWPLLLPMAKSAVAAMDAIQAYTRDELDSEVSKFFVTGGSKRGWTTWLSAAVDDRIFGIAPVVIDTLSLPEQSVHQLKSYGKYSEMIKDYTERDIQGARNSEAGVDLVQLVDPITYCEQLTLPKMIVLGTNDPYWCADSANLYLPQLQGETHLYYGANVGHNINLNGVATVTKFYENLIDGESMPEYSYENNDDGSLKVTWNGDGATPKLWKAASATRDFRESEWVSETLEGDGEVIVTLDEPDEGWIAYYVELSYKGGMAPYGVCTNVTILPDRYPFPDLTHEQYRQSITAAGE
jgi:PhoPQ-activated pathogenicity-related protein